MYANMSERILSKKYLCPKCGERYMCRGSISQSGKMRWLCRSGRINCYQTTDPTAPYRGKTPNLKVEFDATVQKETLVITWAQNATPVHKPFLRALQTYCTANKAQLLVTPGRYKNPTSRWEQSQANEQWWDALLVPFLVNQRVKLNRNIVLLADIRVQPTAVTPLTGFESLTHGESGILGHPKLQMTVIPTPHQKLPKILTTTGSVTVENYTDTKAGKKGEFHHVLGAVIIELDGDHFHLRHINAQDNGTFCDLDKIYRADGIVEKAGPYKALVLGDTHVRFTDAVVDKATFGKNGLVAKLNPSTLVFHDLLDNYATNPHHYGNPFINALKHKSGFADVEQEIREACNWVRQRTTWRKAFIVPSNHNDFLDRWMRSVDWRQDPSNAEIYLETALEMVRTAKISTKGAEILDPFIMWASRLLKGSPNIRCIKRNESLTIAGIECSLHGDQGANGARGSINSFAKIGVKTITGHSHTPGILDGAYKTGTSTPLSLEYTGQVGSWLNAHCTIDPLGKRAIHILVGGKFWRGQE